MNVNEEKYLECKKLMAKDPDLKGAAAAKEVGLTTSSYYFYKAKDKPKAKKKYKMKSQLMTIPLTQPEPPPTQTMFGRKVAIMFCDVDDAAYIIGGRK